MNYAFHAHSPPKEDRMWACYFLLNYASFLETPRALKTLFSTSLLFSFELCFKTAELEVKVPNIVVGLLFSFELCLYKLGQVKVESQLVDSCYFLLNYAGPWYYGSFCWLLFNNLAIFFWIMRWPRRTWRCSWQTLPPCYFLLNYAQQMQQPPLKMPQVKILLFSFELCIALDTATKVKLRIVTCYFLLNYARGEGIMGRLTIFTSLLFSFELCASNTSIWWKLRKHSTCYFLLNYATIARYLLQMPPIFDCLLFSFELCSHNPAFFNNAKINPTCYFLLNYAHTWVPLSGDDFAIVSCYFLLNYAL